MYPWDKYISLGITAGTLVSPGNDGYEEEVLEIIKLLLGNLFFNNLEIAEIKDQGIRESVRKFIKIARVDTVFGAGPTIFAEDLDLNSFNKDERSKAIKRVKGLVEMAYYFESDKFAIAGGLDVKPTDREEAKKILTDSIRQICIYVKDKGGKPGMAMPVVLETFDRDYSHKLLIGPTAEAIEVLAEVKKDFDNIGLMLDLGHQPLIGEKMDYAVALAGNYLKHVHIGNCVLEDKNDPRFGDTHPYLGYPGGENAEEEVARFLSTLRENNYFDLEEKSGRKLPTMNFEIIYRTGDDANILIANMERVFAKAWSMFAQK